TRNSACACLRQATPPNPLRSRNHRLRDLRRGRPIWFQARSGLLVTRVVLGASYDLHPALGLPPKSNNVLAGHKSKLPRELKLRERPTLATAQPALNMDKLNAFIGQFVGDLGAAAHAGMVVIGEKLGLYKALAEGAFTSAELAAKTNTDERYVREWLSSQAAGGYVTFDATTNKFSLSAEQAFTMANADSPAYLPGAFELALGSLMAVPRITESFRTGAGMGWHEHDEGVFHGCEKFFRPGYAANLVTSWIPSLDGVKQKLEAGARVADVGCGKGASTILLAKAYPKSRFYGFDYHDKSIEAAREIAK